MNEYIIQWNEVIVNCDFSNTYKMAWARGIVELCETINSENEIINIPTSDIAKKMLEYYWNQSIYFNLKHGSISSKEPVLVQIAKEMIEDYFKTQDNRMPIRFIKIENNLEKIYYEKKLKKCLTAVKQDVCYRFLNLNKEVSSLYKLSEDYNYLTFKREEIEIIKDYSTFLYQSINYRWTQMLESYNHSPRISLKVRAVNSKEEIERKNLTKFREFLSLEFEDGKPRCFYSGEIMDEKDISIDHVIPWSFMYSDDIWNLVYCTKSKNSSKSNKIPNDITIQALEERNMKLIKILEEKGLTHKNYYYDLKNAQENGYVRRYWTSMK